MGESMPFVDVHHHLNFGLDDGAQTFEEMQKMMLLAVAEGIGHIVCTTHVVPGRMPFDEEIYQHHLQRGQQWCKDEKLSLTLHPGCEIMYTNSTESWLEAGKMPTLANSRTVLVEFMPDVSFRRLCEAARRLGNLGYRVIIAHVERYEILRKVALVHILRDEYGAYMQMNTDTVTMKNGFFTRRWVRRVLDGGCIDVIATDAHNMADRRCRMQHCFDLLCKDYGQEYAEALCIHNPMALLEL